MKRKSLLLMSLISVSLLCGGCGETSSMVSTTPSETQYQIYQKAVEEGIFSGTYEEWLASIKGQDGKDGKDGVDGKDGKDGVGIKSITLTSSNGNIDTYTVTYTDGSTSTFTITNGKDGSNGADGKDGKDGTNGANGADGKNGVDGKDGQDSPHFGETHVVTFSLGEDEYLPKDTPASLTVNYGDTIVLPIPLKPGYVFKGWFTGDTVNDGQWFNHTAVFDDLTLTPKWEKEVYSLPAAVKVVIGAKDVYHYGDIVTIEPVLEANKTFTGYKFDVMSFNVTNVSWNKISSYSKNYQLKYTFGKHDNLVVNTIDTPSTTDGTEGTYVGKYIEDGAETEITIVLDGKGMYTFNGDKSAMEIVGTSDSWTPGTLENLYFNPYIVEGSEVCFYNGSIHQNETMADGNTYSYIEATDDHNEKTWRFWLDGNEYVEQTAFEFAGTFSDGTLTIKLGENGKGTISGTGYTTANIVSSEKQSDTVIILTDDAGETYKLSLKATGQWSIRYEDETFLLDYTPYVFEYCGVFKGTYSSDDVDCNVVINVNKDKTVTCNDGGTITKYTITNYDEATITLTDEWGEEHQMTLQTTGVNAGKWKFRLENGTVLLTFTSFANNPLQGKTFKGICTESEEEHVFTFKEGMKTDYTVGGYPVYSDLDVDISNYPASVTLTDSSSEETYTLTFKDENTFTANMRDDCRTVTYTKQ